MGSGSGGFLLFLFLFGDALGVGQHELDAVFLVDAGGAGVIVERRDVCRGIGAAQGGDHAAAGDVVRQAAERLGADDVGHAFADQDRKSVV